MTIQLLKIYYKNNNINNRSQPIILHNRNVYPTLRSIIRPTPTHNLRFFLLNI